MGQGARRARWQRPGLMALFLALAIAGLAARPPAPGGARPAGGTPEVREAPAMALASPARPSPPRRQEPDADAPPAAEAPPAAIGAEPAGAMPAWRDGEAERGAVSRPAAAPAPDVVVALPPAPAGPVPAHAHVTDSGQAPPRLALSLVDGAVGSGDGMPGPEPGALYWFGPEGLVKVRDAMEAER